MPKQIPYLNEIVSLTIMLLMVVALVAGQASATIRDEARVDFRDTGAEAQDRAPFRTTIKAHINGEPLMISIDATAEFEYFRPADK